MTPIFITLDPQRDTRKPLSAYAPAFHPQIVGLTGSEADIRQVARAYRVYYGKVPACGWLRYTIDHSSFIDVTMLGRIGSSGLRENDENTAMNLEMNAITRLLKPRSVAVIGASADATARHKAGAWWPTTPAPAPGMKRRSPMTRRKCFIEHKNRL